MPSRSPNLQAMASEDYLVLPENGKHNVGDAQSAYSDQVDH